MDFWGEELMGLLDKVVIMKKLRREILEKSKKKTSFVVIKRGGGGALSFADEKKIGEKKNLYHCHKAGWACNLGEKKLQKKIKIGIVDGLEDTFSV